MPVELSTVAITLSTTLIGAAVAGVISYVAGRGMKIYEWRLSLAKEDIAARRRLYAEFLAEADRLILQSMERKLTATSALKELTVKLSEISLLSTEPVLEAAKAICDYALSAHTAERATRDERNFYELKKNFIAAARNEIASYEGR